MSVDTPAKIAVLGAGPIGLEAALYGRFLGYDIELFDRGEVADNVRRWGHVKMFSPFGMNASPLGLAALEAQDDQYKLVDQDAVITGREWRERYLLPLSQTDLLSDFLHLQTTVAAIARKDCFKYEEIGTKARCESPFRILFREKTGREYETSADIVIDATGVFGNANWIGPGGAPAIGERAVRDRIEYGIPDPQGFDQLRFSNKQVLVIGSGHSAATSVLALRAMAESATATRVTWVTRRAKQEGEPGPLRGIRDDQLPERLQLVQDANEAAADPQGVIVHWPGTMVQSISWDESRGLFDVEFIGEHVGHGAFDEIIANVGYRPDHRFLEELQVHWCYATGGPMKLAAQLLANPSDDCLKQVCPGPSALLTPEPNFYVLGAKSYGRNPNFLLSNGLTQIRDLFTIIGDREKLDLYQSAQRLPR
jgi:thioredoxin reductase